VFADGEEVAANFTSLGGLAAGTGDGIDNDIDGTVDEAGR